MQEEKRRGQSRDIDLDTLDGQIIRALQQDGRASIRDLAASFGATRELVSHRLHLLTEHEGLRVVAALDPGFAGHHVLTHSMVLVDGPVGPVAERLAELPDAVFVSMVSGAFPLVFESRHGSVEELHESLDWVRGLPGVQRVRVTTYSEILKGFFVSPERRQISLDAIDYALIAILQRDGRTSYRALAEAVHLSASSARARVHRLIDAGVIRISAIKSGGISRNRLAIGIGITARGGTEPIGRYLAVSPAIDFAARSHGNYDFVATLVGASSSTLLTVIDELRAISEVGAIESWAHFDIVKEDYARTLGRVLGP